MFKFDHSKKYYRTDLKENAFDYLEKFYYFYKKVSKNQGYWKWVIISLHGAIYHLMLLNLRNTDGSGVWKKEIRDENGLMDLSRENEMDIISFLEAFKRIKNSNRMSGYVNSKSFDSNEEINKIMEDLNNWRNDFVHYKPKGWSIEIEIFKDIISGIYPFLDFLVHSGRVFFEEKECKNIENILNYKKL